MKSEPRLIRCCEIAMSTLVIFDLVVDRFNVSI
jgi:hypothetical protein